MLPTGRWDLSRSVLLSHCFELSLGFQLFNHDLMGFCRANPKSQNVTGQAKRDIVLYVL